MTESNPTQEERLFAALSHGSVILFGMGAVAGVVIWATQKDRSRYVAFQALQSVVYQFAGLLVSMVAWCCWGALYFASMIPLLTMAEQNSSEAPWFFLVSLFLMAVPLILMAIWILGGMWGAVRTLQGRDFRYLVIGEQLERWLSA